MYVDGCFCSQDEPERDTSSAEGSNADSGRGASEEGESQSHISWQQVLAQQQRRGSTPRLAPVVQFNDAHLGFETPARRLLYKQSGVTSLNTSQQQPQSNLLKTIATVPSQHSPMSDTSSDSQAPPIPPHEPFVTRSSERLYPLHTHLPERRSFKMNAPPPAGAQTLQRSRSDRAAATVRYSDAACSKDVYV